MENPFDNRIQTVSELTRSIRGVLETSYSMVTVSGEISNLRRPQSGHLYFTLKDPEAQLRAVLFKGQQRYLTTTPADGMEVLCRGRISLYEPRGEYQLIIDYLDAKGAGLLRIAFDQLKSRLEAEGLFDPQRKKALPFLPRSIAVITSSQGAAWHDFLTQAQKRAPGVRISLMPVKVQGEGAAEEMAEAIACLNRAEQMGQAGDRDRDSAWDIIVLCRGGGSLEDLWAFNEEVLARAIADSAIPVVSAVGHEVDFTIADFVADLRAPTPTAAAQMILPQWEQLRRAADEQGRRLALAMRRHLYRAGHELASAQRLLGDPGRLLIQHHLRLDHLSGELAHTLRHRLNLWHKLLNELAQSLQSHDPGRTLTLRQGRLKELALRLSFLINNHLQERRGQLGRVAGVLDAVSPLAVLSRGYAVARFPDGRIIRSIDQLSLNDKIELTLADGVVDCRVENR